MTYLFTTGYKDIREHNSEALNEISEEFLAYQKSLLVSVYNPDPETTQLIISGF